MDYKAIALKKQATRLERIPRAWRIDVSKYENMHNVLDVPRTCGILNEREIKITEEYDAVAIVEGIKARELSAEEVTVAFCKRAAIAQQLVYISPLPNYFLTTGELFD
jgi:amidase